MLLLSLNEGAAVTDPELAPSVWCAWTPSGREIAVVALAWSPGVDVPLEVEEWMFWRESMELVVDSMITRGRRGGGK